MTQFGAQLRLERQQREVTLESLSAKTKLSVRQLTDLEAGNYTALPGGVFRKGFVRSYLGALELDETEWLERFEASCRESGLTGEGSAAEWASFAENVRNSRVAPERAQVTARWIGVFGMAAMVLLAGWALWMFVVRSRVEASSRKIPTESSQPVRPSNP